MNICTKKSFQNVGVSTTQGSWVCLAAVHPALSVALFKTSTSTRELLFRPSTADYSCPSSSTMKGIIPKSKTKGTDFCGVNNYYYIIRSDLGCYMQSSNFNKGLDITIFGLHPACQNGDHYLGHNKGYFYIIKGNSYRRVTDLSTDSGAVVYSLHPNCQGGDHYLSAFGKFYIIFQEKGTYRRTTNMNHDWEAVELLGPARPLLLPQTRLRLGSRVLQRDQLQQRRLHCCLLGSSRRS
ncbi:uncharacterized protein LOC113078465 [Carassius auratus]|uniref:Uncharacterized protein LOC113078465 n=1 Tax=Carassius auratus TaxID=7957 RepID=A0A6P6NEG7_CARAU|nr:uncharacterized protein LOC113078465 [Carassius auratus]